MTWLSRCAVVAVLLAAACGGNGGTGGTKPAGTGGTSGGGGAPAPGQEAGTPPIRGGGGGAFGGGNDPDSGGPAEDAAPVTGDGAVVAADAGRDLASDPPRDVSFTPVDAIVMVDTAAPGPDMGTAGQCGTGGVCDKLEDDFRAALARARSCNPLVKLQCQMTSASGLSCPGCKVWVNSNVELNAIRAMWNDAGCQVCRRLCPAIACRAITTGTCHSKMLAAPPEPDPGAPVDRIIVPPMTTGTCIDQSDPVPF
jgi:hypothetical protein